MGPKPSKENNHIGPGRVAKKIKAIRLRPVEKGEGKKNQLRDDIEEFEEETRKSPLKVLILESCKDEVSKAVTVVCKECRRHP